MGFDPAPVSNADEVSTVYSAGEQLQQALSRTLWLRLRHKSYSVRLEAVQAAVRLGEQGDDGVLTALLERLQSDGDEDIRCAAIKGLPAIAAPGNRRAVAALLERLSADTDSEVRLAAIHSLAALLAPPSFTSESGVVQAAVAMADIVSVAAALAQSLDDSSDIVREAAKEVLPAIACRGGIEAATSASQQLAHHLARGQSANSHLRCATVQLLGTVAPKGDNKALDLLLPCLEDDEANVRASACQSVGMLAPTGHLAAIGGLRSCLRDNDEKVREASVEALGTLVVCASGGPELLAGILVCLEDDVAKVRHAAVDALAKIVEQGNPQTLATLSSLACSPSAEATSRAAALRALALLAGRGDAGVTECVVSLLEDPDELVRYAAIGCGAAVVDRGTKKVVKLVLTLATDADEDIRRAAVRALAELGDADDAIVFAAVSARLADEDYDVRRVAASVLPSLATADAAAVDASIVTRGLDLLVPMLSDNDDDVRQAAVTSIVTLVKQEGSIGYISTLFSSIFEHGTTEARCAALEALGQSCLPQAVKPMVAQAIDETQEADVREVAVDSVILLLDTLRLQGLPDVTQSALEVVRPWIGKHVCVVARTSALTVLGAIATTCCEAASLLVGSLADTEHNVRQAVMLGLQRLAKTGEYSCLLIVLDGAVSLLHGVSSNLRSLAMEVVEVVCRSDRGAVDIERLRQYVLDSCRPLLQARDDAVRRGALDAISEAWTSTGNEAVLKAIGSSLSDTSEKVRTSAGRALGRVARSRGEPLAVREALERLHDVSAELRGSAVVALSLISDKGDARVVGELVSLLGDTDGDVKWEAARALAVLGERGDAVAAGALLCSVLAREEDGDESVRIAAAQALGNIAPKGDKVVIAGLVGCLKEAGPDASFAILQSLLILQPDFEPKTLSFV